MQSFIKNSKFSRHTKFGEYDRKRNFAFFRIGLLSEKYAWWLKNHLIVVGISKTLIRRKSAYNTSFFDMVTRDGITDTTGCGFYFKRVLYRIFNQTKRTRVCLVWNSRSFKNIFSTWLELLRLTLFLKRNNLPILGIGYTYIILVCTYLFYLHDDRQARILQ